MEEGHVKPKRKYTPRPVCADPTLKYKYKPKPGPKPGFKTAKVKRQAPELSDADKRRKARASYIGRLGAGAQDGVEAAERLNEWNAANPGRRSRQGIPDGMTRAEADAAWDNAKSRAEEIFTEMVEKGLVADVNLDDFEQVVVKRENGTEVTVLVPKTDEAKGSAALKEAMVLALMPINQQHRLAAINTVLKYTKSMPAQKVEVTKAEDLLAAAIADMKQEDGEDRPSGPH